MSVSGNRAVRSVVGALAVLWVATVLAVTGPVGAAQATFASQCGSPTSTLDPSAGSVDIAAGQTVLLASGTFRGGINSLPSGATLCVAAGATLQPGYLNNAAGSIVVAADGAAVFPSIAVGTGFALGLEGTATFAGLNINGASTFTIAPAGTLTIDSGFSPGSGTFTNAGTIRINGAFNENTNVVIDNSNLLTIAGSANLDGSLNNTGTVTVTGPLTVNSGGAFANSCRVHTTGTLSNNAAGSTSAGVVVADGAFINNGTWRQGAEGIMSATGLTDDGTINGFGGYQFAGQTSVQGNFVGDAPGNPILVQTQAPAGSIFDVQTGIIRNVLRIPSVPPIVVTAPRSGCATPGPAPFADVSVAKAGPADVLVGGNVTYTLTVSNAGPSAASNVVLTDVLPPEATGVVDAGGGTVGGDVVVWSLGTLAAATSTTRTFTISQASPVGTVLHDTARSISPTIDADPSNNNGTSADSQADTTVVAALPPLNNAPTANPLTAPGLTDERLFGRVIATDVDPGQKLTYTITTPPAHGQALMVAGGLFAYRSAVDFTGDDSFVYTVCDDGAPIACATATVSLPISPVAVDDLAQTFAGTPVVIPVSANDSLGAALDPALVAGPANGTATVDPAAGTVTYTPAAGFIGHDAFSYRQCSPTNAALCATATVTVTIVPANHPPVVAPLTLTTTTGNPVTGTIVAFDPDAGQTLAYARGIPARTGSAIVTGDQATYTPRPGFAGTDSFTVIVCDDGDPSLCATGTITVDVFPIANPVTAATVEGTPVTIAVTDNDLGSIAAPTIATPPANGTATVSGSSIVYTPRPGFIGTDTLTYTICASTAPTLCDTTTVTIHVTSAPAVPPIPPVTPDDGSGAVDTGGASGDLPDTGSSAPGPWIVWAAFAAAAAGLGAVAYDVRRSRRRR